ncbi:hypothetical protein [Streptomyces sp. NPDC014746]|uniref:hypothetical protein n=1 Tax=Streptomyces sp. NPDC014746 TaxID=3364904 RepID=UPI0036F87264
MTTPATRPPLKRLTGTPARLHTAEPAAPQTAVGEPTGAARKGVVTAVRPDPQSGDGRYPVAWLHILAPRGTTPTATSKCLCGRNRSAVGRAKVLALITDHTAHRDTCPLRTTQEGKTAA